METKPVRLTVPLSPNVHAVFSRISESSGVSLGRCVNAWLFDTLDAADFMAQKMEGARQSPRILSRELNAYAAGLSVALDDVLTKAGVGKKGLNPPSSNTGGKGVNRGAKS